MEISFSYIYLIIIDKCHCQELNKCIIDTTQSHRRSKAAPCSIFFLVSSCLWCWIQFSKKDYSLKWILVPLFPTRKQMTKPTVKMSKLLISNLGLPYFPLECFHCMKKCDYVDISHTEHVTMFEELCWMDHLTYSWIFLPCDFHILVCCSIKKSIETSFLYEHLSLKP